LSWLKTSRMNLMDRLTMHLKAEVPLQAEGFSGEPGVLQKVGKRFIRVNGQYYVPSTLQEIVLLHPNDKAPVKVEGEPALIRTTYAGSFQARLVRNGTDFIEIIVFRDGEEEDLTLLIPLNKIISIEAT